MINPAAMGRNQPDTILSGLASPIVENNINVNTIPLNSMMVTGMAYFHGTMLTDASGLNLKGSDSGRMNPAVNMMMTATANSIPCM